jgi:twitching motility protein PilT
LEAGHDAPRCRPRSPAPYFAFPVKFLLHRAAVADCMAKIDAFFNLMFEQKASDVHLSSGNPPILRINGELQRVEFPPLENDTLKAMLYEITPEYKIKQFEETGDVDFGYEIPGVSRFRANFFNHKNGIAAVFRQIPSKVLSFEDFEKLEAPLPPVLKKFAMLHKGLVLVTGPTGSGKSTTLAAMVDYANKNRRDHILTIEDPIEFVHESKGCLVNHREAGVHTKSFASALRGALREDPDIVLVGELRDLETIELAITAASTGHLVFGTLHTSSAAKTVDRIIDVFPADQQNKIRATLSEALKGVVAQNLFKRVDKKGRVAALEILVFTTAIANLVREGKTHQLPGMIQVGKKIGNVPLDDAIMDHLRMKRISPEEAYDKCLDKKKFRPFLATPPLDDEVATV